MRLYKNLQDIITPFEHPVVTIGNFDGVHLGNQLLFIDRLNVQVISDPEVANGKVISGEIDFNGFEISHLDQVDLAKLIVLYY